MILRLFRHKDPLSQKLLVWILALSFFFAFLATVAQLYTDYRESRSVLDHSLNEVSVVTLPSINVAMWNMDGKVLKSILGGVITQPNIEYIEIRDSYNHLFLELGTSAVINAIHRHYPIIHTKKDGQQVKIGQLNITASLTGIYKQLLSKLVIINLSCA
ncbi:hypothetical protein [Dongshaea marina]|uniref:hypothetical protein n=1 Tax=Dongshaea marina TaxID=2047966 RepID=UPI000D3E55ED|nr:hypothetical protein [Dongshaea marina]